MIHGKTAVMFQTCAEVGAYLVDVMRNSSMYE